MKSKTAGLIIILLEILLTVLFAAAALSGSFQEDFSGEGAITEERRGEGFQKTFSSGEMVLRRGIYSVRVDYHAQQKNRKAVNAFVYTESGDERYSRGILADEIPLFGYREQVTGRFYIREGSLPVTIRCRNHDADYDLSVSGIHVEYLKGMSAAVAACKAAALFLLLDLLLLLAVRRPFEKLSPRERGVWFALAGILVLTCVPVFFQGIPDGDDLEFHCFRIANMAAGLRHGSFPVRLHALYANGFGYPEGIMYGDVLLYPSVLLYLLGFPLITAYKAYLILINAATVVLSWLCFRRISGSSHIGVLGSFLYCFSMWRLVDVCSRAAMGEFSAFVFLPLLVLGLFDLVNETPEDPKQPYRTALELIISFTGLLQTHVFTTVMAGMFMVLLSLLCFRSVFRKNRLRVFLFSLGGAFFLNLGYILPFLHYYLVFPMNEKFETAGIQARGIRIADLFLTDVYPPKTAGLALLAALGFVLFRIFTGERKDREICLKLSLLSLLSLFMATAYFPFDWLKQHIPVIGPLLSSVQFPWRYLVLSTILITVLVVVCLRGTEVFSTSRGLILISALCLLTLLQGLGFLGRWSEEEETRSFVSEGAADTFYGFTTFRPHDTDREALYEVPRIGIEGEGIEAGEWRRDYDEVFLPVVNHGETGSVDLPVLAYRGYRAESGGEAMQTSIGENYRLRVTIPAGFEGTVHAYFRESGVYRLAELITLITLAAMIVFFFRKLKKR